MFNTLRSCQNAFLKWLCHFTCLSTMYDASSFATFLLTQKKVFNLIFKIELTLRTLPNLATLEGITYSGLTLVLICTFIMTNGDGHIFMCFHISSSMKCLLKSCTFLFLLDVCLNELWQLFMYSGHKSFFIYMICKCFLPVCDLSFNFLNVLLRRQILILIKSNLSFFSFVNHAFSVIQVISA